MSVKVRMTCTKKTAQKHYSQNSTGPVVIQTIVDLEVKHTTDKEDPNYPYAQLSGGTKFPLCTLNQEAADQFEIGKDYDVLITPAE